MKKHTQLPFFSLLIAIIIACLLAACGGTPPPGGTATPGSTTSTTPPANPTATPDTTTPTVAASVPLKVISIDMALDLPSIRGYKCGTSITETYTATFHFPAHNTGGQVQFEYTLNNGRGNSQPASLTVQAGQTTATYAFSWSGQLPADNTEPGRGGIMVTAPNAYTSDLVAPLRPCIPVPLAAFKVTSIDMALDPPSIRGYKCGTSIKETYTATFHFPAHNAGGQVQFYYTTTNGRGSWPASLNVQVGQTTASYTFNWSGQLPDDNTAPGRGGIMVTAPNAYISDLIAPLGPCIPVPFTKPAQDAPATYTFKWSGTLPPDYIAPGIGIVMLTAPNQLISLPAAPTGLCS